MAMIELSRKTRSIVAPNHKFLDAFPLTSAAPKKRSRQEQLLLQDSSIHHNAQSATERQTGAHEMISSHCLPRQSTHADKRRGANGS
jgi:hypothetical protein